jgi:hypothetical protein
MALPRPPPLAESIRLPLHIFHHDFERRSVGAKDEGEPIACYRPAPFAEKALARRPLVYRPKLAFDFVSRKGVGSRGWYGDIPPQADECPALSALSRR